MSQIITTNDGYLALLDAVYFAGSRLGNLSEEGLAWGGEDAQKFSLFAAQQRSNPVKEVQTRAATNELTGKMIELLPANCVSVMGGKVNGDAWEMQTKKENKNERYFNETVTGSRCSFRTSDKKMEP
jgi:hypothetical protein